MFIFIIGSNKEATIATTTKLYHHIDNEHLLFLISKFKVCSFRCILRKRQEKSYDNVDDDICVNRY